MFDEGTFVYSNAPTVDDLLATPWSTSSADLEFSTYFDTGSISLHGNNTATSFGVGSTTVYGQTVRALQGATSINRVAFTIAHLNGTGPYLVRPFVAPWDSAHDKPTGTGAWFGPPVALPLQPGAPQVFTFDLPNVPVTQGEEYVIGLTTLAGGVSTRIDDQQSVVYEATGLAGAWDEGHGWSASWQEWPNGGVGGPVCARTLLWTPKQGWLPAAIDPQTNRYAPLLDATR